ncbi:MFS transporter [Oceanobacillus kapialis]|uniref:MFS transporter n=1 Tax=Oceanobacillus kapialis TaxID=481353 RepID=A0ABW5Q223_9BACI
MKLQLINKNFSFLWFSDLLSVLNGRFRELVIPLIVLGLTSSPLTTTLVLLSQQLGTILFAIPIGTIVETRNKVKIATICNLLYAVCIFLLTFLITIEQFNSAIIALLLFIMGLVALVSRTAFSTMLPAVAGRDKLTEAHTSLEAADAFSTLLGPVLGGLLLAFSGESVTLFVCGMLSIGSMVFITKVNYREKFIYNKGARIDTKSKRFINQAKDGVKHLFSNPFQKISILVMCSLSFSTVFVVLTVIFHARVTLNLSEELIGIILSCAGAGNIIGILIMKWFKEVNWLLFLTVLLIVSSFGVLLIGLFNNYLVLCIGMLIFDGALSMAFVVQASVHQGVTPDGLLSRVRSATYVISGMFSAIGTLLAGVIPEYWSSQVGLLIGFLCLAIPGVYIIRFRQVSGKLNKITQVPN